MGDEIPSSGHEDARQLVIQALLEGIIIRRWAPGHGTRATRIDGQLVYVFVDPRHLRYLEHEMLEVVREHAGECLRPYVAIELAQTAEELVPYLSWDEAGPLEKVCQRAFERLGEVG